MTGSATYRFRVRLLFHLALLLAIPATLSAAPPIDYNRDIRPLLSNNCYRCHGPDSGERAAGLRLDLRESAIGVLESGETAIVPGKSGASALIQRIMSNDELERMPPPDSGKSLTAEQKQLLKRWIDEGAAWKGHWSFIKPERPAVPKLKDSAGVRNAIDIFVRAPLEAAELSPQTPADKVALIRRATLDLTGLPPTPAEVDAFLADTRPGAYQRLVNRLLASPRFGEHKARYWLDAARYGDTHGLHLDNLRSIWPYRRWVIDAMNNNMPFDQFTIEQLAGDLLPQPTLAQRVATGFNRCNVTTSEGGSIAEEYRVRYAVDRVETTSTVWLGLTTGCAVCHDHKFDPLSQKEFYQLFAFFNNTSDRAMDGNALLPPPSMKVITDELRARQEGYRREIAQLESRIEQVVANAKYVDPGPEADAGMMEPEEVVWIDDALPAGAKPQGNSPWSFVKAPQPVLSGETSHTRTAGGLSQHFFTDANPPLKAGEGDILFAHVYLDPKNPPKEIMLQFNVAGSWEHRAYWGANVIPWGTENQAGRRNMGPLPETGKWVRLEVSAAHVGISPGMLINGWAFTQHAGHLWWDKAGIVSKSQASSFKSQLAWEAYERKEKASLLPADVKAIVAKTKDRTPQEEQKVREYFLMNVSKALTSQIKPLQAKIRTLNGKISAVENDAPSTLVMQDMTNKRPAHVLIRGAYDKRGEQVQPGMPAALHSMDKNLPKNRLGLAQWIVDKKNPLTARVTVNRIWQEYFGVGLVRTTEDFGSQGEWPSHPALLDWLAVEFMESGWDVKHIHRLIVNSATYRQSSAVSPHLVAKDPDNRLLARGPRFRMDGEMIRDQALFTSGLFVEKLGGPSVKPYQPLGLWRAVGYTSSNTARFVQDKGQKLYRRSLYTFWKRTSPPPTLTLLDAPNRETCVVRRERTNTPLAALALMNDVQFVEASRKLARRMMREGGDSPEAKAARGFRLVTSRKASQNEIQVLVRVYQKQLAMFGQNKAAAEAMLSVGDSTRDSNLDAAEHAAWTMVANLILNLDEAITKG